MSLCRCDHPQDAHPAQHAGMCVVLHCECTEYRLRPAGVVRPASQPTLRDLIAAGKRSERAKAQRLAARIESSIAALVQELRAERERVAKRAAVRPVTRRPSTPLACPDCGKTCGNGPGLASHRRNAHGQVPLVDCPDCGQPVKASGVGAHRFRAHGVRKAAA